MLGWIKSIYLIINYCKIVYLANSGECLGCSMFVWLRAKPRVLVESFFTTRLIKLHYTTLHYTSLHYTTLHCTTLHFTTPTIPNTSSSPLCKPVCTLHSNPPIHTNRPWSRHTIPSPATLGKAQMAFVKNYKWRKKIIKKLKFSL